MMQNKIKADLLAVLDMDGNEECVNWWLITSMDVQLMLQCFGDKTDRENIYFQYSSYSSLDSGFLVLRN